jgi:benzoyl-CoA 2,3-dioxygenase component B
VLTEATYKLMDVRDGQFVEREVPMLNALNEVLRDDFIRDSVAGVGRWNKVIEKAGLPFRLTVPHKAFHRQIGTFAGTRVAPDGRIVDEATWQRGQSEWLATPEDRAFVSSLMGRVTEVNKYANFIAPPAIGVNKQPIDFEYVRFN